ncbi:MAG: U32 family peptidase [Anaerolineaceae bacterium]|nr:MAG: U32 family peptidase [Anaerolineaceae bacterium]
MKKIEILAPAGSYESMRAAMNAGCDAVYMGGSRFGARAYANNPDEDTLLKAIEEAHLRNKKLYLTVNTLVKEEERHSLYNYLEKYYLAGLDAVIVQDVGVMRFIHRHFPRLPIHASTQTTITMAEGANLLKSMGVTRLVTARELSFKEIKNISDNTDMEIETFVHGALCYCYSGQCLMSSMIGGRSGNRGRCAQPCRMPYQFFSEGRQMSSENEKYLLSPKDINTVALIPDLIEAGVSSFKIEGRMKSPEYAAGVSYIYRKYVDIYINEGKEGFYSYLEKDEYKKDMLDLMDLYNRGAFSQGYGKTYNGKAMMSMIRPNHDGVPVGEVIESARGYADIRLSEDINGQDILEIRDRENQPVYEFTVKNDNPKDGILKTRVGAIPYKKQQRNHNNHNSSKIASNSLDIRKGYAVYRTRNNSLLKQIGDKYIRTDAKHDIMGYLYAKQGERLQLTLSYNNRSVTAYHNLVEAAIKQPILKNKLRASIDKLGDTLYQFRELIIESDDNIFVPVSWLNEIRREAVTMLSEMVIGAYHRTKGDLGNEGVIDETLTSIDNNDTYNNDIYNDNIHNNDIYNDNLSNDNISRDIIIKNIIRSINISVGVSTKDQFETALLYQDISSIYADYDGFSLEQLIDMSKVAANSDKVFFIMLPHICRLRVYEKLNKDIVTLLKHDEVQGFILKNFEEVGLLQEIFKSSGQDKEVRLNHNMYIFNQDAKMFWMEKGINQFTAPIELNEKELKDLGLQDCELMVYGYQPLMVSVQCLHASTKSCSKCQSASSRIDYLVDRIGKKFFVSTHCNSCYNIIYNGQRLSLLGQADKVIDLKPHGIRLDFTIETSKEVRAVLFAYTDVFSKGKEASLQFDNITAGHFKRGVE